MHYEGDIIRPPNEIDSILLQVATGCPHNRCTFCGAYRDRDFRLKPASMVQADLRWAARHLGRMRRLFLCDGDCLSLSHARLMTLLADVREHLPQVARVGSYASARSLARKSDAELAELRRAGLTHVYMGVESGDDAVLARVGKGCSRDDIIAQGLRVSAAGMKLNVSVIVGLGGVEGGLVHARETGGLLSAMNPDFIGVLSLMLVPGTPLYADHAAGRFALPDAHGLLRELRELLATTSVRSGIFLANHASNHLPLRLRLPRDRERGLALLDQALDGYVALKPEWLRAL